MSVEVVTGEPAGVPPGKENPGSSSTVRKRFLFQKKDSSDEYPRRPPG